ncbi:putative non-catalytic module family expansin protein [Zymoseptoria brevis]|uniref:Putative non-catalytic module family expansin protein n=1 Tax=Zymoseptoria brevis TaxID=1047168 RepID=A0A0F4GIK4_9PEZI|nr:putative non-catalytic module family expansin protein [Zymoseptoria brevis]
MQFFIIASLASTALAVAVEKRGPTHNGVATYYLQGGVAGSCGEYHGDNDLIVAIAQSGNALCGQTVTITNSGGGQGNNGVGTTITAKVVDTCPGCDADHLDLSVGAFKGLTGGALDPPGKFNIQWHLN